MLSFICDTHLGAAHDALAVVTGDDLHLAQAAAPLTTTYGNAALAESRHGE
jgi:hypothetical protein